MEVSYDEDRASHIGPEPCIMFRKKYGEASVGAGAGQPLSLEIVAIRVSTRSQTWKTTQQEWTIASVLLARRGRRHWHALKHLTREPEDLKIDHKPQGCLVRDGEARSRSRR